MTKELLDKVDIAYRLRMEGVPDEAAEEIEELAQLGLKWRNLRTALGGEVNLAAFLWRAEIDLDSL